MARVLRRDDQRVGEDALRKEGVGAQELPRFRYGVVRRDIVQRLLPQIAQGADCDFG